MDSSGLRVFDRPENPDPAFAELYARLPDAVDLEPWLGWARRAGNPALYLGVGAGRLAVPLGAAGVEVVGVDAHPGMLAALARRAPGLELHQGLFTDLDLGRVFPLVMAPSSVAQAAGALPAAARHLVPGGQFALEVMNPHWLLSGDHPGVRVLAEGKGRARIEIDYPGGAVQEADVELWWPEAAEAILAGAGFDLELLRGSEGGLATSPSWFALARAGSERAG